MRETEIREAVVGALRRVQEASGRPVGEIGGRDHPIGDVAGFDSLAGVEATVEIEQLLGTKIGSDNIFVTPDGSRARTVDEVVDAVAALLVAAGTA